MTFIAAWKTPIRINNEIVEKFKTGKRPLEQPDDDGERAKRMKYMEDEVLQLAYLEVKTEPDAMDVTENDPKQDMENKLPPVIMFTGFSEKFKAAVSYKMEKLLRNRISIIEIVNVNY